MAASHPLTSLQSQLHAAVDQKNYGQVVQLYEQLIQAEPAVKSHYWGMGLALLLQGQEAEAQMTWFMALADEPAEQVEYLTLELVEVLAQAAEKQAAETEWATAWVIRQHIRELAPAHVSNLLHLLWLSLQRGDLSPEDLSNLGILDRLPLAQPAEVPLALLGQVLEDLLTDVPPHPLYLQFAEACLPLFPNPNDFVEIVLPAAVRIAYTRKLPLVAADLAEMCLRAVPDSLDVLMQLAPFYQNAQQYDRGIAAARHCFAAATNPTEQVFGSHLLLRGLMNAGGYWDEALTRLHNHEALLQSLVQEHPVILDSTRNLRLLSTGFFFPYFRDDAIGNRKLQNQLLELCHTNIQLQHPNIADRYAQRHQARLTSQRTRPQLKVGYISHCFCNHSVGWLARWLIKHHDRQNVQVFLYFVNYKSVDDYLQLQYSGMDCVIRQMGIHSLEIAEQIFQDDLDILVDLDSITLDVTCEVMSLKPAPIQVTWLGWDASGLPAIDYYIADPYVLPDEAQTYYREKIWRLPHTYLAVDGFEVGVPTLKRSDLDIPADAVVYLSAQRGYKRHRDTARLQLQILKAVPNSYFLIKGFADQTSVQGFFRDLARDVGVDCDRLRFLPDTPSEDIHRANLSLADVVLDTFPYNGATTTMETLWVGIPLVTRVGQQFAARNSYTMLVNAGIEEGIAWSDEEYVEWGVRFGMDSALRQQVAWKLWRSRQTAPLWNARQFARDMEQAYQQMWHEQCRSISQDA